MIQTRLPGLPTGEELQVGQFLFEEVQESQASQLTHRRTSITSKMETALLIPEKTVLEKHSYGPLSLSTEARSSRGPTVSLTLPLGRGSFGASLASAQRLKSLAREHLQPWLLRPGAGAVWRPQRSSSRASWVTVRSRMENNRSQGSRIQASTAVSCSRHTTRSAQKLSSRDTWQTKQW